MLKHFSKLAWVACVVLGSRGAHAQDLGIQNWTPTSPGDNQMIGVHTTQSAPKFKPVFGLALSLVDDPLVLEEESGDRVSRLVDHRLEALLSAAVGIGWGLEVGLTVPILLSTTVQPIGEANSSNESGFGDIRFFGRYKIAELSGGLNLGVRMDLSLPTATDVPFAGHRGVSGHPSLVTDWRSGDLTMAANLGLNLRGTTDVGDLDVGTALTFGLGAGYDLPSLPLRVIGEIDGDWAGFSSAETPVEARAGVSAALGFGLSILGGYGYGLISGYGAPDHHLFLAATFPSYKRTGRTTFSANDPDGDGILGDDKCPDEAEDFDGFEDEDGCPEADNDGDGFKDADDGCINHAEDKDGYKDEDGCPDLDNDIDGILDQDDKCPLEAEIINGVEDDDGCPDEGEVLVVVGDTKIEIREKVFFANNKDEILPRSETVLNQLAKTIVRMPWIEAIRIEGHTDDRGDNAFNQDLSKRRAESVLSDLVRRGVESSRLVATGYGEEQPIDNNATLEGRANNRRVEFVIIKQKNPPEEWRLRNQNQEAVDSIKETEQ